MYFGLRGNAAALTAGPGVSAVRRRILAAALLHDRVVLEPGLHHAWSGPSGGGDLTAHGEQPKSWQSLHGRGRSTGSNHYIAMRLSDAPEDSPFRAVVHGPASFSWNATYEPFRQELPASAARWLDYGYVQDEGPAKELIREWTSADDHARLARYLSRGRVPEPEPAEGRFVQNAVLKGGYFDLAMAAVTASATSLDRRHQLAVDDELLDEWEAEAARIGPERGDPTYWSEGEIWMRARSGRHDG